MSLITSRNKCNLDSTNIRNKLCDGYSGVPELHAPRRFKESGRRIYPGDPQMRLQTEADGRRAADALVQHFNHNPPLAYEPALAVYTDGSLQEEKEGPPLLGAGIYRPETTTHEPVYYLINPNGRGPTRTINRAELAAIYHALHDPRCCSPEEPLDIFTDSQAPGTGRSMFVDEGYAVSLRSVDTKLVMLQGHQRAGGMHVSVVS
ncbi:hypothetical protein N2152v2_001048 [Parachlorella kessleri]